MGDYDGHSSWGDSDLGLATGHLWSLVTTSHQGSLDTDKTQEPGKHRGPLSPLYLGRQTNVGPETRGENQDGFISWASRTNDGSLLDNGQNAHIIHQKEKNNAARKALMKMFVHNQKRYRAVGVICKFALGCGCELKWQILHKLLTRSSNYRATYDTLRLFI